MNPTVTVSMSGGIGTGGVSGGTIGLVAPYIGEAGPPGIWHLFPIKSHSYLVGRNLTPRGRWRGDNGTSYKIGYSHVDQGNNESAQTLSGALTGTGHALGWTGTAFAIDTDGNWVSKAELLQWNAQTQGWTTSVQVSRIGFYVNATGDEP
jgi:hypothetical protein